MATLNREVTKEIVNRLLTAALDSAKYVAEGDTFKDEIAKQFGVDRDVRFNAVIEGASREALTALKNLKLDIITKL